MYQLPQQPGQDEGWLVCALEEALSKGNVQHARQLAERLARAKAMLSVRLLSHGQPASQFRLDVQLETASQVDFGPIPLQVSSGIAVFGLKVKMAVLYRIPMQCQRWIIGKKIPRDSATLKSLGITATRRVFLYVLEAKAQRLTREENSIELDNLKRFHEDVVTRGGNPDLQLVPTEYERFVQERTRQERFWHLDAKGGTQPRVQSWSGQFAKIDGELGDEGPPPAPTDSVEMQEDGGFVIRDRGDVHFNYLEIPSLEDYVDMGTGQRMGTWSGGFADVSVGMDRGGDIAPPAVQEEAPEFVITEVGSINSLEDQTEQHEGTLALGNCGTLGGTENNEERIPSWASDSVAGEVSDPYTSWEADTEPTDTTLGSLGDNEHCRERDGRFTVPPIFGVLDYGEPYQERYQSEVQAVNQLQYRVPYLPLPERRTKQRKKANQTKTAGELIIEVLQNDGHRLEDCQEAVRECGTDLERAQNYFKECDICYTAFPMSKITGSIYCQCHVCTECFTQHYTVLAQSTPCMFKYVCPVCQHPERESFQADNFFQDYFGLLGTMLHECLAEPDYDLYQSKMMNWGLMKEENFRWCVHGCGNGFINEGQQMKLQCPGCKKHQCFGCKKPWVAQHDDITCEEFDAWKRNNDPEFQQLGLAAHLKENGINCPKCKMRYELAKGGCMHFKCPQCQHEFCCGCNLPFMKHPDCRVSQSCRDKGLHAHHPRDCLYHLRDSDIGLLQQLLQNHGIDFTPPKTAANALRAGACSVRLQLESNNGLVDNNCGKPVVARSGLCELHYKEYLVSLINQHKVDPVDVFTVEEMGRVLARHEKQSPPKQRGESAAAYQTRLRQVVKQLVPLNQ